MSGITWKSLPNCRPALLGLLFAAAQAASVHADSGEGHAQINEAVEAYLQGYYPELQDPGVNSERQVEIELGRLDPRLRIDVCPQGLETRLNQRQEPVGRVSVRVDCRAPDQAWTRYVQATIRVYEPVLVSSRSIDRGERLGPGDMQLEAVELSTIRQTGLREAEAAEGMEARRRIAAGTPLTHGLLAAPRLVERGDTVVISAQRGTAQIQNQATALQGGALGDRINVRNERSQRVIQATITGSGQARVEF